MSSVVKISSDVPLGKKIVHKAYDLSAQMAAFKALATVLLPDPKAWRDCFSGSGASSCIIAGTDLPLLKALKLVPDSVIKKGAEAVEGWLKKTPKGCKCFLAGTDVLMADGTSKDIEDVEVGDDVLATDPETGESGPRRVTRLIVTEDDKHFNELSIATEDGIDKLTATHEHPFWSPSEREWIEARNLKPGMTLLTDEGDTVIVTGNRSFTKHARTYNLTVDDLHTYYVLAGETPVLVHNSNCPSGKAPRTPDGKFAKRNGEPGTDGSLDERTVMDQLELDGARIIRGQVYVRVPGFPLRKYDGAVEVDGRWLGVETKGGSSPLTPPQRRFDDWLNTPGNSVTISGGITLDGTFNAWVPR